MRSGQPLNSKSQSVGSMHCTSSGWCFLYSLSYSVQFEVVDKLEEAIAEFIHTPYDRVFDLEECTITKSHSIPIKSSLGEGESVM